MRFTTPSNLPRLVRESVYAVLESGMTLEEMRTFLIEHGKKQLPANVAQMLSEWAGKRESLVLCTHAVLALGSADGGGRGSVLSGGTFLLPPNMGHYS